MEYISEPIGAILERQTSFAVDEYCEFAERIEEASARMRNKTVLPNFGSFINRITGGNYLAEFGHGPNVFMTDCAHKLPFPQTVYHVTGGSALEALMNGKKILPSNTHFSADIKTDKGSMINLVPRFMKALGIQVGNLEQFVFSGPEIDWEQFAHIRKIKGLKISNLSSNIFFDQGNINILNKDLDRVLEALDNGIKVSENNELKSSADRFIQDLWEIPNIREGWLDRIRSILYGDIQIINKKIDILHLLQGGEDMSRKVRDVISKPPVVLEISTSQLISETTVDGLTPLLVGNRPIESIFASVAITPGSVTNYYAHPDDIDGFVKVTNRIRSINDIPKSHSLGGVWWTDVRPNIDNPLCAIRYNQSSTTWREIAEQKLIAPAKDINQSALSVPPMVLLNLFGASGFKFTKEDFYCRRPMVYESYIEKNKSQIKGVYRA